MRVWELDKTPVHYQLEALVILRAEQAARMKLAKDAKAWPVLNVEI